MEGMENKMEGLNKEIKEEMKEEMKEMRGETQNMGIGLKKSLDKLKEEMKKEVGTIRAEVTGLKEKVKGVGISIEANKKEMANEIKTVVEERQIRTGNEGSKGGTRPNRGGNEEQHKDNRTMKGRAGENKRGIGSREEGLRGKT